jgi:cyclase
MSLGLNRRQFVEHMASLFVALGVRGAAWAQTPPRIAVSRLTDDVLLFRGAGCNVVAVMAPEGVTLVDGGLAEESAALLAAVTRESGGRPVRTLINTHWHSDHTGSNESLGRTGAGIVAHANTRRWLDSRVYRELDDRVYPRRPGEALPSRTFTTAMNLTAGTIRLECVALPPAHTSGDVYVRLADRNIVVVGDILTPGRYPVADYSTGGWINGLIEAATRLDAITNSETQLVPGLGPIQTQAALRRQREMLVAVRDRVWTSIRQGKSLQEVIAEAPTREFDAERGASDAFLKSTYTGLVRHSRQLGGVL